jgi:hypothetical protein
VPPNRSRASAGGRPAGARRIGAHAAGGEHQDQDHARRRDAREDEARAGTLEPRQPAFLLALGGGHELLA